MGNKKGQAIFALLFFGILVLLVVIGSIAWSFIFRTIDSELSQVDVPIGDTKYNDSYEQYMQPTIINAATTMPRIVSLSILIGMILIMFLLSYSGGDRHRLWIILDLIVIIVAFAVSVIVKGVYIDTIKSLDPLYEVGTTIMYESSKFILNLPIIVAVTGVLMMLLTYGLKGLRKAAQPEEIDEY